MLSRKNIWLIIIVVGLTLSIFSSDVWGENLVKYYENDGTIYYYYKDSVKYESGKVKLWITMYWGGHLLSKGIEELRKMSIESYQKLSYSKSLLDMNCKEQTYRLLEIVHYDEEGRILYGNNHPKENYNIVPESIMVRLKSIVCR